MFNDSLQFADVKINDDVTDDSNLPIGNTYPTEADVERVWSMERNLLHPALISPTSCFGAPMLRNLSRIVMMIFGPEINPMIDTTMSILPPVITRHT